MTVRVGIVPLSRGADLEQNRELVAAVADSGLDHLGVTDHVSFWVGAGNDGLIDATALSMLHPTLPIHTAIYQLVLRHPVVVARQLSTLSALAPGRLVLGVGVGGEDRHEAEVCGVDPATRGRRMDESLVILRGLLAGQSVTHHGKHFTVDNALVVPAPPQPIPIIVGGRSDAAVRRAARLGDGWLGLWNSPSRFASVMGLVDEVAGAAGREGVAWQHGMQVWCGFGRDRAAGRQLLAPVMEGGYQLPFEKFERYSPCGTPEDIAEFLAPYVQAGARTFNLMPVAESLDAAIAGTAAVRRLLVGG